MPENTIWGVIVRIWQGVIRVGNRTAVPVPASGSLVAGTVTIESAGNSTNGKLEMEATTSGGTVRKLTLAPSQSMTGSFTITGPTALPGSTQYLTISNTGQLATAASAGVGGTGTDNQLVMWDGTTDIQDVPNWSGAGGVLQFDNAGDTAALTLVNTGNTRTQFNNDGTMYWGDSSGSLDTTIAWEADGAMSISGNAAGGAWRFKEAALNGTSYIEFKAPDSLSASTSYELPSNTPSDGDQLTWNTGGTLSWEPAGGGGSGIGAAQAMAYASMGMN